jgi:hypothetical protein
MRVSYARGSELCRKGCLVELRILPRTRNGPNVNNLLNSISLQQTNEILEATGGMAHCVQGNSDPLGIWHANYTTPLTG